jgi:hypothetical protein
MTNDGEAREQPLSQSEQAARWWADFLRNDFRHDAGDFETTTWANYFADEVDQQISAEKADAFEHALCDLLQDVERPASVSVDYDPGPLLRQASERAGIEARMYTFPIKTSMWIARHDIYVVPGAGARRQTLDEWYQEVASNE